MTISRRTPSPSPATTVVLQKPSHPRLRKLSMLFKYFPIILPLAAVCMGAPTKRDDDCGDRALVQSAQEAYKANTLALLEASNLACTPEKVSIRRAWDDLSYADRLNYIEAVKCLETLPTRLSPDLVPGARNWRDDFTYAHINQSNFIHNSGLLLPWHRQFVWAYEQSLRQQCGYMGYLPYWAWERHTDNQSASPVWQPDPASFGSNGRFIPHGPVESFIVGVEPPISFTLAAGSGGGCITDGPFANSTINLGPVSLRASNSTDLYGLAYNPRCITRDFVQDVSARNLTHKVIADLYRTTSIHDFHPLLENIAHPNSHGYVGGGGVDFYASPNEPVFFLIHAQIDRLWSIWQGLDYSTRSVALDGTVTIFNIPPSENAVLDTVMHMGVAAGGDIPIRQAMTTFTNDYCYIYV